MMEYFGIKSPSLYIGWIAHDRGSAWKLFFSEKIHRQAPLEEAIRAYEAIGYRCVEVEVNEKVIGGNCIELEVKEKGDE